MPNTLHLIDSLAYGGAATQLRLLAGSAAQRGERASVATLRYPAGEASALADAAVGVTWLRRRFGIDPIAAARLRRLVSSTDAEVVQTWDLASARLLRHAFAGRSRPAWVHTLRECRSLRDGCEPWLGRLMRSADAVIAPSGDVARRARRLGVETSRVSVAPNAAPDEPLAGAAREAAREELNHRGIPIDESTPVVVAVTRIVDAERVKEIAWAADLLRVVQPGLRMLIAGDGPRRADCRRFAEESAAPRTVFFLGPVGKTSGVLAAADACWCASDSSAEPTPLLEAMAAGLPVVASHHPGRERLVDGSTGRLVAWDDRVDWTRQTDRLLRDRESARAMGAAGAERVRRLNSQAVVAEAHSEAVQRAVTHACGV